MNGVHCWRLCGLLLLAVLICGCDASRPSSSNAGRRSKKVSATPAQWDLEPPKSVAVQKIATPPDPGATFKHYCSVCHGLEGRGDGQYYSDDLPARPADLTNQTAMQSLSDEHLTQVITEGSAAVGKSPLCPPWGRVLSKEQVADLVSYVRQLPTKEANASQDAQ